MPKRPVKIIALLLLLLTTSGFAVWEILVFVQNTRVKTRGSTLLVDNRGEVLRGSGRGETKKNMELLQNLIGSDDLFYEISAAPPATPPKGAKLIRAVGRNSPRKGYVQLQWAYEITDDEKSITKHYAKALQQQGFTLRDQKRKAPRLGMVFHRYPSLVTLSLRLATVKSLMLVTVCENRPADGIVFSTKTATKPNNKDDDR